MDLSLERDSSSALGSLFQQIINDLKNTSPLWEDFVTKATKLHQCLRAAIQAIAAYLDAFQKIADAATNSRGASKEIGTALTRVCLRHKAVESRLKTFTTAIMDCLVQPLQEKLEDWKRTVITIDKEHAKEYKRCRTELKKRSSDTLRLQKKARKGQSDTIQSLMDSHKQDVTLRRAELEEVEKKSLRSAMIEERLRYCTFVHMLQPVVKEECEVMSELGHLQEAMDSIALVTKEPSVLPQASEELIHDTKATMSLYPESPGGGSSSQGGCSNSLGSRKSSVCSISSMNSSGSSNSPGHHHYPRSLSQLISPAIRLKPGESSDSGFCSSPALTTQASTATSQSHAVSTWPPHSQDAVPVLPPASDRPHTISTAYEKGHQRPPLTVYTFQNPETILEGSGGSGSIPGTPNGTSGGPGSGANTPSTQKSPAGALSRPPLPVRCSSLERPLSANNNRSTNNLLQRQCPSPIPAHITKELSAHHAQQHMQQQQQTQQLQQLLQTSSPPPTYVNMSELANMAAAKITNQQQQQQRPVAALQQQHSIDSISSQFSNDSTASGNQQSQQQQHQTGVMVSGNNNSTGSKTRSHSVSSSSASSNTPSLHSHPSIESGTIATPLVGQTPTPSSGSSTPQNHYSPLLTNSPSSTAAGTPSGGSVTSGMLSGFVYNVNSPTPPQSGTASVDSDVLKITETDAAGQPTIVPIHETNTQQQETSNANNNAICIESQTTPTETSEQTCTNAIDSTATANDTESPTIVENDERSRASVLQKASMFEKQAAAAAGSTAAVTPGRSTVEAIYGTRRTPDEVYRTANPSIGGNHYQQPSPHQQQQPQQQQQHVEQQEVDKSFEDSIQELNNLIGELDSFQREIDASKRATATTTAVSQATTADGTVGDNCGDRPFPLIGTSSNSVVADNNKMGNNAKAITTLATVVTEAERVDMTTALTVICPPRPPKSPQCASNQTSGCGTDLSDTASDDVAADVGSLTSINNNHNNNNNTKGSNNNEHNASLSSRESCATGHDNNVRTLQQYNSDSELSRCYVSETSSLAGGYENPTFAHFATAVSSSSIAASSGVDEPADVGSVIGDNRSLMAVSSTTTADDCASHTSDTYQMPQQAADNGSDGGSNVVVIYDHQIPMTPDIDYVKQNSEIVVLRTKDPLQQQLGRQEMRELTQLPTSLCAPHDGLATPGAGMMSVLALSSSSLSCLGPNSPPHTATVAPAKQRLSSFRASSEQQLQLLGCGDNNNSGSELSLLRTPHHHHQQYANAGTPQAQTECSKEGSRRVATPPNAHNMHADTIIRRKAAIPPPKPSLSIFNGQAADHLSLEANASVRKSSSSSCRGSCEAVVERLTATPTPPPPLLTKANFKADLDAKIRKQKLKLQLQHEQQQHHELLLQKQQLLQEQQQLQHSPQSAANNTNSSIYLSNHSHNNLNHNNSNNTTINNITTTNTTTNSGVGNGLGNRNSSSGASSNTHNNSNNNNCNAISLNKRSCSTAMSNATTTKTTTASASASASASNHLAFVVKAASSHHHTNASASSSLAGPQLVYQNVSVSTCAYACSSACATPTPPTIHTKQSAASASVSSASASASNSNINSANAKPNITPRPASLSGGVTRIARRSSVNTAKPPPPVRRSSSVTPSHTATGTAATQSPQQNQQQQQQQHQHYQQLHHLHPHANQQLTSATTTTIQNSPYDTVESLPPPPAYLLDSRQAQSSTPTPPPPSAVSATAIPSSSLKVAETVKALSAMRHKPASPNAIRHMQQQQQQQLQQSHQSLQTFSSTALLPPDCNTEQTLHYDAYSYYNPYMEVRTTTQLTSAKMPLTNANHANDAKEAAYQTLPITPTPIYYYDAVTMQPTTMATTPTKSKHLQSNALQDTYGVNTALRTTPNKTNNPPVSPSYTSPPPYDFQHSKIELPPPLPPPNPNQQRSLKQQQQKQFVDHQYNTPATCTLQPSQYQHNNNQLQPKRQHEQIYDYLPSHQHLHSPKPQHKPQPQPQQQTSQIQQQQQLAHNIDALMIDNEDEPTVYSDNASFRTSSPGIYAQPKIVTSMSSFRSASPAPTNDHHNQHHHVIPPTQPKTNPNLIAQLSARLSKQNQQQHTGDGIYGSTPNSPNHHNMHQQQLQQQQHQHQHHQSEPVYMRNYTHPHHQQHQPHQQQQMPSVATGSMHQQQNYDAAQTPKHQSSYAHAGGVARQQQQQQQQQHHSHHREPHTHSCPPPLENPPPPPTNSSIYAATANATATMPKNATRSNVSATYAPPTSTMTLPKNLAQQRLQQQQHYQQQQQHYQQQQYQQSIATGANAAAQQHHQAQQHSQTTTVNQRAQMPLPYQQQQQMSYKQKSATLQSNHRQPPIPSRHSSVQQKIFVATNPFIQTTTIHCHSPASVHSQPASPTCSSPSSLASIYGTSSRSHHHHHHQQQQQQQHQHHGSGSGVGGGTAGNGFYAAPHNSTSYASSNIEKAGSIRSKTKAEFLENLNAKLAKQGLSGRAFAVRNLINSKALMYQNPQTLMRPSAQYRAQPQAPPTPPTSSAEESSSH
ncbi:pneumococcal serine-rich repeat protein isoform X7 [Bactrocera oleae]|uniref:pneumococcal serine-rich repeat protein isoform X7 n=1 Tax=Bactrocera oleae TaxID=104688 RepID=UPI00387E3FFC